MSTASISTDERAAFVEALQECGTRQQRDALTRQGRETHNQAISERLAELGWLGCCFAEEHGGATDAP